MLNTIDINYATYLQMTEDQQYEYNFVLTYMKNAPVIKDYFSSMDLTDRPFVFVKELQDAFINDNNEELYSILTSIPEYSQEFFLASPAYKVIHTLSYILSRIQTTLTVESEMLVSHVNNEDYTSFVEQVDFSMFPRYYSELRELAENDITRFETIKQMKYSDCLVELIYRQKQSDFERLVMKSKTTR